MSPLAMALLLQVNPEAGLTPFSWTFMLVSMGGVTLLAGWCFNRILRAKDHFDPDGTGPAHPPVPGRVEEKGGS